MTDLRYSESHRIKQLRQENERLEVAADKLLEDYVKLQQSHDKLLEVSRELVEYTSYAEITNGISINRPQIKKWCDETMKTIQEAEELKND